MATGLEVKKEHTDEEERIELFTTQTETADSVIPLRWCVCPKVFQVLEEKLVKQPFLFIVVVDSEGDEQSRQLVPLEQLMTYVSFKKPGLHRIYVSVVWSEGDKAQPLGYYFKDVSIITLAGYFESRYQDRFDRYLESERLGLGYYNGGSAKAVGYGKLQVAVAKEFFAKKPSEWLWKWVNLWFPTEARDQCQFRRRCYFLAFTVQPIAMGLFFMAVLGGYLLMIGGKGVYALLLILAGTRNINFKRIFCMKIDYEDYAITGGENPSSVFLEDKEGEKRPAWLVPFMPLFVFATAVVSWNINRIFDIGATLEEVVLGALGINILLAVFLGICTLSSGLFRKRVKESEEKKREKEGRRKATIRELAERQRTERLELERQQWYSEVSPDLVCTGVAVEPKVKALPSRARTFRLKYLDLKAKVCKPFAK